jgi:deoxyribonuclease V
MQHREYTEMRMNHYIGYPIPKSILEAAEIQNSIALRVRIAPLKNEPAFVAGVDAAFFNGEVAAAASLFTYPGMLHVEDSVYRSQAPFPYIPGFFSFREGPAALGALLGLKIRPDVVLFDGQGIAHPRGAGIASYLGVVLGVPAIGCAKSRLIGEFDEPGKTRGDRAYLYRTGERRTRIGAVVRTRTGVKPVFVSPGHLVDIDSAVEIVLGCVSAYRIPEPLRRADHISRRIKKEKRAESRPDLF